jgi:hypothetical protein
MRNATALCGCLFGVTGLINITDLCRVLHKSDVNIRAQVRPDAAPRTASCNPPSMTKTTPVTWLALGEARKATMRSGAVPAVKTGPDATALTPDS